MAERFRDGDESSERRAWSEPDEIPIKAECDDDTQNAENEGRLSRDPEIGDSTMPVAVPPSINERSLLGLGLGFGIQVVEHRARP